MAYFSSLPTTPPSNSLLSFQPVTFFTLLLLFLSGSPEMARPNFAHLWQQEELSDVDILLHVEPGPGDSSMLLRRFPGHSQLLSLSPYFMALVKGMDSLLLIGVGGVGVSQS